MEFMGLGEVDLRKLDFVPASSIFILFIIREMDPSRVELKICSPHQPVRLISARLSGQIKALQTLWPNSRKRFIYNGQELIESMTFNFYRIKEGDSIIALPADEAESVYSTNQWLNLTRDSENFNDCMRWMLDQRTAGEAARLRDLHIMKMESG